MSAMSNYMESGLIGHLFRTVPFTAPASNYIGLVGTYSSGNLESGLFSDELSGGGYSRVPYIPGTGQWSAPVEGDGHSYNLKEIQFPRAVADWGNVSGVFISDGSSAGNLLYYAVLSTAKDVKVNDTFTFQTGDLDVYLR